MILSWKDPSRLALMNQRVQQAKELVTPDDPRWHLAHLTDCIQSHRYEKDWKNWRDIYYDKPVEYYYIEGARYIMNNRALFLEIARNCIPMPKDKSFWPEVRKNAFRKSQVDRAIEREPELISETCVIYAFQAITRYGVERFVEEGGISVN